MNVPMKDSVLLSSSNRKTAGALVNQGFPLSSSIKCLYYLFLVIMIAE